MMSDFESLMDGILNFFDLHKDDYLNENIRATAENQRQFKSKHKYDLEKFGLTEEQIKKDCAHIYNTFLS